MNRTVTFAVTQFACVDSADANGDRAEALVREAAARGANVILLQELFETPYFCKTERPEYLRLSAPLEGNLLVSRFASVAKELGVVLPVSFFERAGQAHFNSHAMVDADGQVLGLYRKSHIPDGPGYEEKYYFSPGDTGFRVWDTAFGRLGVGIYWASGSQKRRARWLCSARRRCSIRRRSAPNHRLRDTIASRTGKS